MHGQENFPADCAFYGIQLYGRSTGIFEQIGLEIRVGTSFPAGPADFQCQLLLPSGEADSPREIQVPRAEQGCVNIPVQGAPADHEFILVFQQDTVDRLPVLHQGRDDLINPLDFFFG